MTFIPIQATQGIPADSDLIPIILPNPDTSPGAPSHIILSYPWGRIAEYIGMQEVVTRPSPVTAAELASLHHLTRDLHNQEAPTGWHEALDSGQIVVSLAINTSNSDPETRAYSMRVDQPADGWADGADYVLARVHQGVDRSTWRAVYLSSGGDRMVVGGNSWSHLSTVDSIDYYEVIIPGERALEPFADALVAIFLETTADDSRTYYDGELSAGIVTLDALADAVAARLLPDWSGKADGLSLKLAGGKPEWST